MVILPDHDRNAPVRRLGPEMPRKSVVELSLTTATLAADPAQLPQPSSLASRHLGDSLPSLGTGFVGAGVTTVSRAAKTMRPTLTHHAGSYVPVKS